MYVHTSAKVTVKRRNCGLSSNISPIFLSGQTSPKHTYTQLGDRHSKNRHFAALGKLVDKEAVHFEAAVFDLIETTLYLVLRLHDFKKYMGTEPVSPDFPPFMAMMLRPCIRIAHKGRVVLGLIKNRFKRFRKSELPEDEGYQLFRLMEWIRNLADLYCASIIVWKKLVLVSDLHCLPGLLNSGLILLLPDEPFTGHRVVASDWKTYS